MSTKPQRVHQNSVTFDGITSKETGEQSNSISKIEYFIGVNLILFAGICFSFQSCWVKFGKKSGYMPFQLLLVRGIVQFLCTAMTDFLGYLCTSPHSEKEKVHSIKPKGLAPQNKTEWMHVAIMGILAFLTAYFNYSAIQLLPLGMF